MTENITTIENGTVTSPQGFQASGVAAGLKKSGNLDLGLLLSQTPFQAAAVFTTNQLKGNSLLVTKMHLENGTGQAVWVNSGNANACTGRQGWDDARNLCRFASDLLRIAPQDILPSSTGVIGEFLPVDKLKAGLKQAQQALSFEGGTAMAHAIMTTDTAPKSTARQVEIDDARFVLGGVAKGSGMIHPNMATMLAYITTDAAVHARDLRKFLNRAVAKSFNRISVDGDTSCCDTVLLMANGAAACPEIAFDDGAQSCAFQEALDGLCLELAKKIAHDGEGVEHVVTIQVHGAECQEDARQIAAAVAKSPLVKTAICGLDPNWGRLINAAGYSGVEFDPQKADLWLDDSSGKNTIQLMHQGMRSGYNENEAHELMKQREYTFRFNLNAGQADDFYITTDLTERYIDINADYRNRT